MEFWLAFDFYRYRFVLGATLFLVFGFFTLWMTNVIQATAFQENVGNDDILNNFDNLASHMLCENFESIIQAFKQIVHSPGRSKHT